MKKIILFCFFILIPSITYAYTENDNLVVTDVDKNINWSFGALSSVLRDLLGHHCKVKEPELYILSEFIYKQKPNASLREIKNSCENNNEFQKVLFRYITKSKDETCPLDGEIRSGFEQKSGHKVAKTSCQYYVEMLVNAQNNYVKNYGGIVDGKSGFYVKKVSDKYGGIYEIVDFIRSGNISKDNNITIVKDDGKMIPFGIDMVEINSNDDIKFPIMTNVSTSGFTRGIHERSYIYKNIDLTEPIMKLCRQFGDPVSEVWTDVLVSPSGKGDFYPGNTFDIKNTFCNEPDNRDKKFFGENVVKNLRVDGQTDGECNVNAVVFDNKIVTLQWLGHFLYGCKESVVDGGKGINSKRYKNWAKVAQVVTNFGQSGQAKDDGVFIDVQDIGRAEGSKALVFSTTQTATPEEAIKLVKNYMVNNNIVNNESDIEKCEPSECGKRLGKQDYIICRANKKVYQYEFDDICDGRFLRNTKEKIRNIF
ncbi:MAG: hypothetical protein IKZ49_01595 [Alphaproteobacteria bacterium]|nr:hypothetical protein [Alphaproteobacteria bacterium]